MVRKKIMTVRYTKITTKYNDGSKDSVDFKEGEIDFCCVWMDNALADNFVVFEEVGEHGTPKIPRMCISHSSHYPEGCGTDYMPIHYCPNCKAFIRMLCIKKITRLPVVTERVVHDVKYEEVEEK